MSEACGHVLSAFAGELLWRAHATLGGAAFGRLAQELVVGALRRIHPSLHENRVGTPDASASEPEAEWAWEIKYINGEEVQLSPRDIKGLQTAGGPDPQRRLLVLDVAFPARLWVLDAADFSEGSLRPEAHANRQRATEAERLAAHVEAILLRCDVGLLDDELTAKKLVRDAAASP